MNRLKGLQGALNCFVASLLLALTGMGPASAQSYSVDPYSRDHVTWYANLSTLQAQQTEDEGDNQASDSAARDADETTQDAEETPPATPTPRRRRTRRPPRTPAPLGESLSGGTFTFSNGILGIGGVAEYPVPGRVRIAENTSPFPRDRLYFDYSSFNNAVRDSVSGLTSESRAQSLDRGTFSVEKTLQQGLWSVELRLPMMGTAESSFGTNLVTDRGGIGNLTVIAKKLLWTTGTTTVSGGLGVSTPTGDDWQFRVDDELFQISNRAVHLLPFLAFVDTPNLRTFYQGFLQLDLPVNGNQVQVQKFSPMLGPERAAIVSDQHLLYLDLSAGYWLYDSHARLPSSAENNCPRRGLAAMAELHYTTNLNSADIARRQPYDTNFELGRPATQFGVLDATVGLHVQLSTDLVIRVATVFPLSNDDHQFFDSEIKLSVIGHF